MSTFRRIDSLLDGKTSEQLATEIATRERERDTKTAFFAQVAMNHSDCVTTTHPRVVQAPRR
jgi:hypothetical protein